MNKIVGRLAACTLKHTDASEQSVNHSRSLSTVGIRRSHSNITNSYISALVDYLHIAVNTKPL